MKTMLKKSVSVLLSIIMIVSLFTIIPFTSNAAVIGDFASVGSGRVITWSGDTLKYAMAYRDSDNVLSANDSAAGISLLYTGGQRNMKSGFYNELIDNAGNVNKYLRLNKNDSELTFTSATENCFITKIVINFDEYYAAPGESTDTMSLYVNHEKWSKQDATLSGGKHTLTLTGPAARNVTLRTGRLFSIRKITSVSFYLTDNLWSSVPNNFYMYEPDDGGLKIENGKASYGSAGYPFLVRVGGKIAGFSKATGDNTHIYEIADPVDPITFETLSNNTVTVNYAEDIKKALGSSYVNKVNLGSNITLDSGLTISRPFEINLNGKTLSCDSSAANRTFTVNGEDHYTFKIYNGTVNGFDNLIIDGHAGIEISSGTYYFDNIVGYTSPLDGNITLSGGEYHLSQGLSGWVVTTGGTYYMPNGIGTYPTWNNISGNVKLQGGKFKLYDTFTMDKLSNNCPNGYAPFKSDEGWSEVRPHYHFYYRIFEEREDGSLYYIHRCDGCDRTVSEWTLTKDELDTLYELNGGALTDNWQWDRNNPGTAKLKLTISEDTYNTALAEPYNMNEEALRTLRDKGFFCGPEKSNGHETVQTNKSSEGYSGSFVDIACSQGNTNDHNEWGATVGNYHNNNIYISIPDRTPMTLTAKNGRLFSKVIFHIGAYTFDAVKAWVDHGKVESPDNGETLVVTDIHSDTLTLHSSGDDWFQVSSVEVYYYDSGASFLNTVTVSTARADHSCDNRTASYTYKDHTYTHTFEGSSVPIHDFRYDFTFEAGEEKTVTFTDSRGVTVSHTITQPVFTGVTRTCVDCGLTETASGYEAQDLQIVSPTYTEDGAIKFPVISWYADGTPNTSSYDIVLPRYTLVHYPHVDATCEDFGYEEVWYDEETHQCYSDAEGHNFVKKNDGHLTIVSLRGNYTHVADDVTETWMISPFQPCYVTTAADGSLTTKLLTPDMINAMSSIADMPSDFTPIDFSDLALVKDVPAECDLIISFGETPAHARPISPLGHHYDPETEVTFTWNLVETKWGFWNNETQSFLEVAGYIPHATASFVCDRCGKTISKEVENEFIVSGNTPTFDSDARLGMEARIEMNEFGYEGEVSGTAECDVPKLERVYTKVEAKEATFYEAGNIEYYSCNDGKGYRKNSDGTYTALENNSWIIRPLGSEVIYVNASYDDYVKGRLASVNGFAYEGIGMQIENQNGTPTDSMLVTAEPGYDLSKVIFHVSHGADRSECAYVDKGRLSLSDDRQTITVTNINSKTVTLSTNFSDEDWVDPGEPDPDMPDWEPMYGFTCFYISSVEVYVVPNGETIYTKVPAVAATPTAPGNTEYYTGSDGKYYVKDGDNYTEIEQGSWVIPTVTLTKVDAKEPTITEEGNREYYIGSDGKYYILNGDFYTPVDASSVIIPVIGTYTVTWKNYNGAVLETDKLLVAGTIPSYDGATPTKPADDDYIYNFTGWTPEVVPVSGNATYTATFTAAVKPDVELSGKIIDSDWVEASDLAVGDIITRGIDWFNCNGKTIVLKGGRYATRSGDGFTVVSANSAGYTDLGITFNELCELYDYDSGTLFFPAKRNGEIADAVLVMAINGDTITIGGCDLPEGYIRYEYVYAREARPNMAGNTEYYKGSDGKYYVMRDGSYVEIAEGSWIIPPVSVTFVPAKEPTATEPGNKDYYLGSDGNAYRYDTYYNEYIMISADEWFIPPTGGSGGQGSVTAARLTFDLAENLYSANDMPGDFVEVDLDIAKAWTGADQYDRTRLVYGVENEDILKEAIFYDGRFEYDTTTPAFILRSDIEDGENIYYVTGGSGSQGALTVNQLSYEIADNMYSSLDMPGDFVQVDLNTARSWTGAPQNCRSYLIYGIEDEDRLKALVFEYGEYYEDRTFFADDFRMYIDWGESVYYVTGGSSGSGGQGGSGDPGFNPISDKYDVFNIGRDHEYEGEYYRFWAPDNGWDYEANENGFYLLPTDMHIDGPEEYPRPVEIMNVWNEAHGETYVSAIEIVRSSGYGIPVVISGGNALTANIVNGNSFLFTDLGALEPQLTAADGPLQVSRIVIYYEEGSPYSSEPCTVTWKNWDGSVLETDSVEWGDFPSYNGSTPTRASEGDNAYVFAGWSNGVTTYSSVIDMSNVIADVTFTAVFNRIDRYYTITWKNDNGSVIDTTTAEYGTTPTHANPTKAADVLYTYKFSKWSPNISKVTGNATYTASFTSTKKTSIYIRMGSYNGVPVDWYLQRINGTGYMMLCKYAIKADKFGSNATYKTSNIHNWLDLNSGGTFATDLGLTKAELSLVRTVNLSGSDGDGSDTFIIPAYGNDELNKDQKVNAPYNINTGALVSIYWLRTARDTSNARVINHGKDGSPVATVAARYSGVGNNQWIRPMFYLSTADVLKLAYTGSGTEADPYVFETRYSVSTNVTSNGGAVSATATRDGKTIYSGSLNGSLVSGAEVTLNATPAAGYSLKSITVTDADNNTVAVTGNKFTMPEKAVTVTVEFEKQKFTVVFLNEDGTVLQSDELESGDTPEYIGETPAKAEDDNFTYEFTGWDKEITAVTENVTYTAQFNAVPKEIEVTYTKVDAVEATYTAEGNTEYYIGSDGKYYQLVDGSYREIAENSWIIPALEVTYTKVEAIDATYTSAGNTEYYIGSDGKYYELVDGSYREIEENSWIVPALEVTYTKVEATDATYTAEGNTEYYIGSDGKYYELVDGSYREIAENSWIIPALEVIYTKVDAVEATYTSEGNTEYYIGSDGKYYELVDGSYREIEENSWIVPALEVTYTKVEATDATYTSEGNTEYYIGSDGKFYELVDGSYREIAENSWIIPIIEEPIVIKNGPNADGCFYIDDVLVKAYKLVEFEGDWYFIAENHKYVVGQTRYLSDSRVNGTPFAAGYYQFDESGRMQIPHDGPEADGYFYISNEKQMAYHLIQFEGDYYFIAENNKYVTGVRRYLNASVVDGTDFVAGYYEFDESGRMQIPHDGPEADGYFYINNEKQMAYQLIQFEGDYYFIAENNKYVTGVRRYLNASVVEGTDFVAGYYEFDENGKMIVKNGIEDDYYYVDGVRQNAYQLIEIDGDWYFIAENNKIVRNMTRRLDESMVENTPFTAGSYEFDAEGRMVIKNGIQDDYYYVDGVRQNAYQLIKIDGDWYFIAENNKIVRNARRYLNDSMVEGTPFAAGYYEFDDLGRMINKNGPDADGYFYVNNEKQLAYKLIQFQGDYYFVVENNKYAKSARRYLNASIVEGTGLKAGYYNFDENGKMILN